MAERMTETETDRNRERLKKREGGGGGEHLRDRSAKKIGPVASLRGKLKISLIPHLIPVSR